MSDPEFRILVAKMRKAQKNYYKTRSIDTDAKKSFLQESKRLEKEVDDVLAGSNPLLF
jgi:hypothetical protein